MIGNGVTNWTYDNQGATLDVLYWYSLLDQTMYQALSNENCDFSGIDFGRDPSESCIELYETIQSKYLMNVNLYNVYGQCFNPINTEHM